MTKKLTPKQRQYQRQNRWINKNYTAVTYRVKPEIAAAFREKCADWGISQASVISGTMKNFTEERITKMLKEKITVVVDSRGTHFDITDNAKTEALWFAVQTSADDFQDAGSGSYDFVEAIRDAAKEIDRGEFDVEIGIYDPENSSALGELRQDDVLDYITLIRDLIAEG
jgi:hypothetical protein